LRDPFAVGVSLGDMIRSQKYDYLYQQELAKRQEPGYVSPGDGGNTGFFYVQGSKKTGNMIKLFQAVVDKVDSFVDNGKNGADQPIFWQEFNEMRGRGLRGGPWGFKCVSLCGREPSCKADEADTLNYCGLDPWLHPTGWEDIEKWKDTVATYHANYAANELKEAKMARSGGYGYWDKGGQTCTAKQLPGPLASASSQPGSSQSDERKLREELARVVKIRAGVYQDKAAHPEFVSTVLVTAVNTAYMDYYRNWECLAK